MTQWVILASLAAIVLLILIVRLRHRLIPKTLRVQLMVAFVGMAAISVGLVVAAISLQIRVVLTEQTGESFVALSGSNSRLLAEELGGEVARLENLSNNASIVREAVYEEGVAEVGSGDNFGEDFAEKHLAGWRK